MKKLVDLSAIYEFTLTRKFTSYEELITYFKQFSKGYFKERGYYCEEHHIIPKCAGGSDEEENLVYLDLAHHAIAHDLLYREYLAKGDKVLAQKNLNAATRIIGAYNKYLDTIPEDVIKLRCSIKQDSIDFYTANPQFKGFKYVTDGNVSKRIHPNDLEVFLKDNPTFRIGRAFNNGAGSIWVTDGEQSIVVKQEDIETFFKEHPTWKRGMGKTKKHTFKNPTGTMPPTTLGKIWVHKGTKRKNILPEELSTYEKEGWIKGSGNSKTNLGKKTIHKENEMMNVPIEDLEKWLSQGWELGRTEDFKNNLREAALKSWAIRKSQNQTQGQDALK